MEETLPANGFLRRASSAVPSFPSDLPNFPQNPSQSTLESSFSRLNITHSDQLLSPEDLFDPFSVHSFSARGAATRDQFAGHDSQSRGLTDVSARPVRFHRYYSSFPGMDGTGYDLRGPFFPGSYQTPNLDELVLNQNGFLRADSTRLPQQECNGLSHINKNVIRRPPRWLQESPNRSSLEGLRGKIVAFAKDQYGCKFLQRIIGDGTKDEIFMEVINDVDELMVDPFGNFVVQKLAEVCSVEQRTQILRMLTQNEFQLVCICLNPHGTHAVQKLLEHITTSEQVSIVMSALSPGAVALTGDMNGHHVIDHCLKHFTAEANKHLLAEVTNNCFAIATDKSGCCVLQQFVKNSRGEARDRLVAVIIENAALLSEDRYGNYVVQHLLDLKLPQVSANIFCQLKGRYTDLSYNKYGSNVVEKCLSKSNEEQSAQIILELIGNPKASMLLIDPYGNYVIQSALSFSKGQVRAALLALVQMNAPIMRSNMYGKKVLAWIDRRTKMLQMETCTDMRK